MEYAIPTLKWKDAPLGSKSFALELIVNENGKDPHGELLIYLQKKKKWKLMNFQMKEKLLLNIKEYLKILSRDVSLCIYLILKILIIKSLLL